MIDSATRQEKKGSPKKEKKDLLHCSPPQEQRKKEKKEDFQSNLESSVCVYSAKCSKGRISSRLSPHCVGCVYTHRDFVDICSFHPPTTQTPCVPPKGSGGPPAERRNLLGVFLAYRVVRIKTNITTGEAGRGWWWARFVTVV